MASHTMLEPHSKAVPAPETLPGVQMNAPQAIRLDLSQSTLDDILKTARAGGKPLQMKFGKDSTINYGNKTQHLRPLVQPSTTELYTGASDGTTDLALAGLVSHRLAIQRAREVSAGADEALARLQSQMAAHKADRQSNAASLLSEGSKMLQQATLQSKSSMALNSNHRRLMSQGSARSLPTSPSLTATRSPVPHTTVPASISMSDDPKGQKLQAIRVPLIHLLAIRPVSAGFLSQKIGCTEDECKEVLQKVGQQYSSDNSKFDLAKQAYKELDVWAFAYQSDEDRQSAIDRAISAFDRQRIAKEDQLWQRLLPREERGKGKYLSRLNLHAGQAKKAVTPKINVQDADNASTAPKTTKKGGDKQDRLAPSDADPTVRSHSQSQIKKASTKEKEAQSKRILANAATKPVAPSKVTKPINGTVKRAATKTNVATGKIKSAEYVHDSDDEDSDDNVGPPKKAAPKAGPKMAAKPSTVSSVKQRIAAVKKPDSTSRKVEPKAVEKGVAMKKLPSSDSISDSKSATTDSNQESVPMSKSQSRQRNTSSPHKPSPLGSSPPANASDMDIGTHSPPLSSASSTPLVSHSREAKLIDGVKPKSSHIRTPSDSPMKRKANDIDSGSHSGLVNGTGNITKRQKPSPMSPPTSDSSTGGHKGFPQITGRDPTVDLAKHFKKYYEKYHNVDCELRAMARPPREKVAELIRMRDRLLQMKQEIARGSSVP